MNIYEKSARDIMEHGDKIIAERERKSKMIKRISLSGAGVMAAAIVGIFAIKTTPPSMNERIDNSEIEIVSTAVTSENITSFASETSTSISILKNNTSKTTLTSSVIAASENKTVTTQKTDTTISDLSVETTVSLISGNGITHSSKIPVQTTTTSKSETVTTSSSVRTTQNEVRTEIVTRTEMVTLPQWREETITEQFPEFEYNGKIYTLTDKSVTAEYIDGKLGNVTLTGCDYNTNTYHTINGDVFKIKNISDKCNAALKYEGIEAYYVYFCRDYCPQTLGELMDDIDIENTVSINEMYVNGSSIVSDNALKDLLALFNSCREVQNETDYTHHKRIISFSTDIPILGVNNRSMALTYDGYFITNILEYGYSFYLGEDKVNEYCRQLGINEVEIANKSIHNEETIME